MSVDVLDWALHDPRAKSHRCKHHRGCYSTTLFKCNGGFGLVGACWFSLSTSHSSPKVKPLPNFPIPPMPIIIMAPHAHLVITSCTYLCYINAITLHNWDETWVVSFVLCHCVGIRMWSGELEKELCSHRTKNLLNKQRFGLGLIITVPHIHACT